MRKGREMKKNIIILSLLALLLTVSFPKANAQIFILSEQEYLNSDRNRVTDGQLPIIPNLGTTLDQYGPLGGGWLLLGGMGCAYLLGKRRKKDE